MTLSVFLTWYKLGINIMCTNSGCLFAHAFNVLNFDFFSPFFQWNSNISVFSHPVEKFIDIFHMKGLFKKWLIRTHAHNRRLWHSHLILNTSCTKNLSGSIGCYQFWYIALDEIIKRLGQSETIKGPNFGNLFWL